VLPVGPGLQLVELGVQAAGPDQRGVIPAGRGPALVQDDDQVGHPDRGKTGDPSPWSAAAGMLPTRCPAAISARLGSTEAAIAYPATANDSGRLVSHMSRTAAPYPGPVMAPESRLRTFCGGPDNSR
jgi:hypothetical protein